MLQVVQKIGLCICLWDILWTSEGLIGQGDGFVNVNGMHGTTISVVSILTDDTVEFRMVVFRPFKGEVIVARIADQSAEGINRQFFRSMLCLPYSKYLLAVATDFFDDIFVPWTELPEGSELYVSPPISQSSSLS